MKIKLLKFKSVKSTNDTALRLIKIKYSKPTIVTSLNQTKGRGTMGKKWISKKGNLFFTIFFELNQKKINFKHFAILNAYLIRRIISKEFKSKIKIKWPNDLLFSKKKICGILQETITYGKKKFLIVGMGKNKSIIKHWRQDWLYQNTHLYEFVGDRVWESINLKKITCSFNYKHINGFSKFILELL